MNQHTKIENLKKYIESKNNTIELNELRQLKNTYPYIQFKPILYTSTIQSNPKLSRTYVVVDMIIK